MATVKMLDFGLAKAIEEAGGAGRAGGAGGFESPTMTSPAQMTGAGVVLGTAAYMAPEQAKGKAVDKRADIWAFGCVLFEMLTGRAVFAAETVTETLAAVMRDAPPLDALPGGTPPRIRRLLARCLQRDPRQRLRDIGDARIELDAEEPAAPAGVVTPARRPRTLAVAAAVGLLAAVAAGAAAWRLKPAAVAPLRKLDLALNTNLARLSPDGSRIAYVSGDRLFVRDLAASDPRDLGTMGVEIDIVGWSPDSATVFATAADGKIRTVPASGGRPLVICEIPESHDALGIMWIGDELVVAVWRGGLYRVDARGGTPQLWLAIDPQKEVDFHGLAALPDGRVVFATHRQNNEYTIETFDGAKRETLLPPMAVTGFWYAPTGHLLFVRSGVNPGLWSLPFGRGPLDIKQAFLVASNAASVSVANDGTLLVRTGSETEGESFELVAVNRDGSGARPMGAAAPAMASPALSPDGRRVAMTRSAAGQQHVWIQDTEGPTGARLTFDDQDYAHPAWFPSGDRVIYSEYARGLTAGSHLVAAAADGSGKRQPLVAAHRAVVSPDGRDLLYVVDARGVYRLRHVPLEAGGVPGRPDGQRVFTTDPEPDVRDFSLSPDGSLLAYVEIRAGRADLLLTRYPTAEGTWQVMADGGRALMRNDEALKWARGTGELFFAGSGKDPEGGRLMAAAVRADGSRVTIGQPTGLFELDADALAGGFDVTPDGKTFLMRRRSTPPQKSAAPRFVLIQNWFAEFAGKQAAGR